MPYIDLKTGKKYSDTEFEKNFPQTTKQTGLSVPSFGEIKEFDEQKPQTTIEKIADFLGMEKFGRRIGSFIASNLPESLGGARESIKSLEEYEKQGLIEPGTVEKLKTGGVPTKEFVASGALTALTALPISKIIGPLSKIFSGRPDLLAKILTSAGLGATFAGLGAIERGGGIEEAIKSAKGGALIGGALPVAGKMIGSVGRHIGEALKIKPDIPVKEASERLGVELPLSSLTKSKVIPLLEAYTGKGIGGSKLAERIETAQQRLAEIADNLIKETAPIDDPLLIGKKISESFEKFREQWIKTKNNLYDLAEKLMRSERYRRYVKGEELKVNPSRTLAFLNEIIKQKRTAQEVAPFDTGISFLEKLRENLKKPDLSFDMVRNVIKEFNDKYKRSSDPVITGNRGVIARIIHLLHEDLDNAVKQLDIPEISKRIDEANRFYAEGLQKLNSHWGKKIYNLRNQPDKILSAILNPSTSLNDIPQIIQVIGEENLPFLRVHILKDIFDKSRNVEGLLIPGRLSNEIKKWGEQKLTAILTPEQYQTLKDIELTVNSMTRLGKITEGSQTFFLLRYGTILGTAFGINPLIALRLLLGDLIFNKIFSSESGRRFLLETLPSIRIPQMDISPITDPLKYQIIRQITNQ
jgi:hypothetical protein